MYWSFSSSKRRPSHAPEEGFREAVHAMRSDRAINAGSAWRELIGSLYARPARIPRKRAASWPAPPASWPSPAGRTDVVGGVVKGLDRSGAITLLASKGMFVP